MDWFWISYTAARYQLWNALERSIPLEKLVSKRREPAQEAEAQEAYTSYIHPLRNIAMSRAGRFSAVAVRAAEVNIISWQTAAEYLNCAEEELKNAADQIRDLFPAVFSSQ